MGADSEREIVLSHFSRRNVKGMQTWRRGGRCIRRNSALAFDLRARPNPGLTPGATFRRRCAAAARDSSWRPVGAMNNLPIRPKLEKTHNCQERANVGH